MAYRLMWNGLKKDDKIDKFELGILNKDTIRGQTDKYLASTPNGATSAREIC